MLLHNENIHPMQYELIHIGYFMFLLVNIRHVIFWISDPHSVIWEVLFDHNITRKLYFYCIVTMCDYALGGGGGS